MRLAGRDYIFGKARAISVTQEGILKGEIDRSLPDKYPQTQVITDETRRDNIAIPKHSYGAVIHLIIHDWDETTDPSLKVNVRVRVRDRDTFGYMTDKIKFNELDGGKSVRLPAVVSIYVCPEAMYLLQYPPKTESSASSVKFIQLSAFPVRLTDELALLKVVEGQVEIEHQIDYLT